MRALSLFCVLALAKVFALPGGEAGAAPWVAFLWQDALVALLFLALDRGARRPRLAWVGYGVVVGYTALNLAVVRVLSAPLTVQMWHATDLALADSIGHHVTLANVLLPIALLVVAVTLPWLLRNVRPRAARPWIAGAMALIAAGPWLTGRVTAGHHCNGVVALLASTVPRVAARPASIPRIGGWRRTRPSNDNSLAGYRGVAADRNVVLVILESVGARYLKPYGADLDPMPNLSKLAAQALVFQNAYAVYPESIKGLVALQFSLHPAMDTDPKQYRKPPVPALAAMLAERGYDTALFHSGRFDYLGMQSVIEAAGYRVRIDAGDISGEHESSFGVDEPATVDSMLAWVDEERDAPFFLTYMPVAGHHPYDSPDEGPFPNDELIGAYRNSIHCADRALGRLIKGLRQRQLFRETLLVVVGDHGQAFGQHPGNFGHTFFLYDENVHVPLLVAIPGHTDTRIDVATVASHVDLAPTVLDLLGAGIPRGYEGRSLLLPQTSIALLFTDYALAFVGLRDAEFKFVHQVESDRSWLFDLAVDPGETLDLSDRFPRKVADYRRHLLDWIADQRAAVAGWNP